MRSLLVLALLLAFAGCGTDRAISRVIIATGTTIGLKATPGDGSSRPPQVTFGYKRAEASIIPTKGMAVGPNEDAFSTLAAFHFETRFFGETGLDSFIGTGRSAVAIQQKSAFSREIAEAAKVDLASFHNRVQLAAVRRIAERYRAIDDAAKRDRIRQRAVELKLVAPATTDADFAGALQDSAVGGKSETTDKLEDLDTFAASVTR
jgi:hypothetical protein